MGKASKIKNRRSAIKAKKPRDLFPIIITAAVAAIVLVIGMFVVIGNTAESAPAKSPASTSVDKETGAIKIGSGPTIIDEYLDFGCPYCGVWNKSSSSAIADVVERDLATLNIYPIAILDNYFQGSEYSTRAASATYCVADSDTNAAYAYIESLYENQPAEGTEGLDDEKLIELAKEAGAPNVETCITNGEYKGFVKKITETTPVQPGASGISTPTVLVNGEFINTTSDPQTTIVAVAENN